MERAGLGRPRAGDTPAGGAERTGEPGWEEVPGKTAVTVMEGRARSGGAGVETTALRGEGEREGEAEGTATDD